MKKQHPDFITGHPFKLKGHAIYSAKEAQASGAEVVAELNGNAIVRYSAPLRKSLALAEPLTEDEQIEIWRREGMVDKLRQQLDELASKARNGDGKALWRFAQLTVDCCEALSDMAHTRPKAFRPMARGRVRWPLMKSTHPLNCDSDDLLRSIQLAEDVPLQFDKLCKWKTDYAGNYAIELYQHVESLRQRNPTLHLGKGKSQRLSEMLSPFNKDSAAQWWEMARRFLLATYPQPEKVSELDRLVPTTSSKRKSPGRRKHAILDILRKRFLAIAP